MTEASDPVIVAATRTPIGRSGGALAGLTIEDIGMQTVAGVMAAAGLTPEDIDDLILGEVLRGGGCTARYVANALGLPPDTPGGAAPPASVPTPRGCRPTRRAAAARARAPPA